MQYFVAVGTPIILLQLIVVYKLMLSSPGGSVVDTFGKLSTYQYSDSKQKTSNREVEGTFNGFPIHYEEVTGQSIASQVHCIGESYEPKKLIRRTGQRIDVSWQHRSCHFQFFCYDIKEKEYVLYEGPTEKDAATFPKHSDVSQSYIMVNQTHHDRGLPYAVAIGGINGKWTHQGIPKLKWYPKVRSEPPKSFYALPADVAMIPFHSLASFNPGHLVWDDFLPVYSKFNFPRIVLWSHSSNSLTNTIEALMHIFGLDRHQLLGMRYVLPGDGLWASCDWRYDRNEDCTFMLEKFGSLMVSRPDELLPFSTNLEPRLNLNDSSGTPKSNMICAKHGAAGLGALTDHGTRKGHGWELLDYKIVHNLGRGGQLWRFRNFMMQNLGVPVTIAPPQITPLKIIFSENSSNASYRNFNWKPQIKALQDANLGPDVVIESYQFQKYTLKEQVEIIGQAAILVTAGGGGAVTATFLPRGASAIIFYGSDTGLSGGRYSKTPARLDFDLFNNMAYVRTHWVGTGKVAARLFKLAKTFSSEQVEDIEGLVTLIKHDLDIIRKERMQYDAMTKVENITQD